MSEDNNRFYGKFRGIVTDNRDPLNIGRIRARVPDVLGDLESGWAMPAVPFAGSGMGFFAVPHRDAGVWIEFECGDPDYPIWTGCWWGSAAELPSIILTPPPPTGTDPKVVLRTNGGHSIMLDDTPGTGGITLETSGGQKIVMSASGIEISISPNCSVKLQGPTVSINNGGLEVT